MTPFEAPVEDILFSLEYVAEAKRLPHWDAALAREIVQQFARFAESKVAPTDEASNLEGCRMETGRVKLPQGMIAAYEAFVEQGWPALFLPDEAAGPGVPGPVAGALTEILVGASHALQMLVGLVPGAIRTIARFGTEEQRALWLPRLGSGRWLTSMALTEPGAGSDLSGIRTRAVRGPEGFQIEGEKIFISGGDHNLTPRILHLVLARTGDAAESGVKGLSLFLVPSHDEAGARLPVNAARIEEKMGLHGSPTCQMLFEGAPAQLLGAEGQGLRAMFTMMNHARLDVALQGVAHATRASRIAASYAATRRQGRAPGHLGAAPIIEHADVRRMLDEAETLALGGRALSHIALVESEVGENPDLIDFLTPVCKFACTEAAITAANLGIQVLGGYGYLREYRVEQVLRDARITAIYEGTNGIHALTLATRLLHAKGGIAAEAFATFLSHAGADAERELWQQARAQMLAAPDPSIAAHEFMWLTAEVALAVAWTKLAAAADHAPDPALLRRLASRQARLRPEWLRHRAACVTLALNTAA